MQLALLSQPNSGQYPTAMQNIGGQSRNVAMTFHRNPTFHM